MASGWAVAGNAKGSKNILGVPGVFCEDSGVAQGWPLGKVGLGPLSHVRVFPCNNVFPETFAHLQCVGSTDVFTEDMGAVQEHVSKNCKRRQW